ENQFIVQENARQQREQAENARLAAEKQREQQQRQQREQQQREQEKAFLAAQKQLEQQQREQAEKARLAEKQLQQQKEQEEKARLRKLKTAKADFTKLDQLLAAKNWKDADIEMGEVMLKIMGREEQGWLTDDNCKNFPREELKIIDSLWVHHSNGYYGFSVQKDIWTSAKIGGKVGELSDEKFKKLGDEVGWRKGGNWYSYSDLSLNKVPSIKGQFPRGFGVVDFKVGSFLFLFSYI
ncbi:MAG TPA: GUN4 domain-containing protein, partial [Allocoleopsis sp.]